MMSSVSGKHLQRKNAPSLTTKQATPVSPQFIKILFENVKQPQNANDCLL